MLAIPAHPESDPVDAQYVAALVRITDADVIKLLELTYEDLILQKDVLMQWYSTEGYEAIVKKIIWFSKSELSFDDFYSFPEIRNNFHAFFCWGIAWDAYWILRFYKKFAQENPAINKELREIFSEDIYSSKIQYQVKLLHQAYCIMLSYPEVTSNADLFT